MIQINLFFFKLRFVLLFIVVVAIVDDGDGNGGSNGATYDNVVITLYCLLINS